MLRLSLVIALAAVALPVRADCVASASGSYSLQVRSSALSGVLCFSDVTIHRGAACAQPVAWGATLACSETRRIVPTDHGALVALLALRAPRDPDWELVRVFEPAGNVIVVRSVRARELAIEPRSPVSVDAHAIRWGSPPRAIETARIAGLGRRRGSRPLRRPVAR